MQSAFGVEHGGEVTKAFNPLKGIRAANATRGLKRASATRKTTSINQGLARGDRIRAGAKAAGSSAKTKANAFVNTPVSISGAASGAGQAIGGGFKKVGEGATKYPVAAGTAVIGGVGAAGIASSRVSSAKREKKIRAEYEKK